MTGTLIVALEVEARKFAASRAARWASALLVGGIALLTGAMTAAAEAGNEQILAQLGELADRQGWARLVGIASQITAAASLLGFGVIGAWTVAREFSDGTISGLFALPVARETIMTAKLCVLLAWSLTVAAGLAAAIAIIGSVGFGTPDAEAVGALARLVALTALSGLLSTPAAWIATLGRSVLAGVAAAVTLIVITQVAVISGSGAWFPLAAPALWAADPAAVSTPQLALVSLVPLIFGTLCARSWSRLQLD